ncbi:MAG: hypothetical protein A3I05_07835 [Deltaproteobacteria bacterium RIFCSPLOWO2_02_FULL_44_10]|nr:MAG: hypothetical protein A3C46_03600 [Deltaproteobacteria bacterium RIFCSPHIGHO2_02_FULL_44_16]OGQ47636.1 MAG: hypothetical protein A3I05_07835 [Deltaproteobacteria bacterium RIFCSPLOWO2_02_FULL_44_10]
MKIIVASDKKTALTDMVIKTLHQKNHEVILAGDLVKKNGKWAEIAIDAAQHVVSGEADQGIFFCWSGTGICIAANKVKGARAALCSDPETAQMARKWNDANILCLSLRATSEATAISILDAWFSTKFDEEGLEQAHMVDRW